MIRKISSRNAKKLAEVLVKSGINFNDRNRVKAAAWCLREMVDDYSGMWSDLAKLVIPAGRKIVEKQNAKLAKKRAQARKQLCRKLKIDRISAAKVEQLNSLLSTQVSDSIRELAEEQIRKIGQRTRQKEKASEIELLIASGNVAAIYRGSDGTATRRLNARLTSHGNPDSVERLFGTLAALCLKAQKASSRAKQYRRSRGTNFRAVAYDRKGEALREICELLQNWRGSWGWGIDERNSFHRNVLYIDLPTGQVSWHSECQYCEKEFPGNWDESHESEDRILAFASSLLTEWFDSAERNPAAEILRPTVAIKLECYRSDLVASALDDQRIFANVNQMDVMTRIVHDDVMSCCLKAVETLRNS